MSASMEEALSRLKRPSPDEAKLDHWSYCTPEEQAKADKGQWVSGDKETPGKGFKGGT